MKQPLLVTLALSLAVGTQLHAEIIGLETFAYSDGPIADQAGGTHWDFDNITLPAAPRTGTASDWDNVIGAPTILGGRLITNDTSAKREYNGPGEGADQGSEERAGAVNPLNINKQVYYRATLRTGSVIPTSFGLSSCEFGLERLFFGKRFGEAHFGLTILGGDSSDSSILVEANTTYTLVTKVDFANSQILLFVDPDLDGDEPTPSVELDYTGTDSSTAVQLASGTGDDIQWSNLLVATDWIDLRQPITVTTAVDENGPDLAGNISLREALAHSPANSLIIFDQALDGETITLGAGQLVIDKSLTIDASSLSLGLTIDAEGVFTNHRVMEIRPNVSASLHGLTLTGGKASEIGGGIYADGSGEGNSVQLTLHGCTLFGNSTDEGTGTGGSGGGIYNDGSEGGSATLTLNACALFGNSASEGSGGGIYNDGALGNATLSLSACTLSGNSASEGSGGGIYSDGASGNATLSLSACTLSGNSASEGSGGGIYSDGASGNATLSLSDTILADNTAFSGPDLREIEAGAVTTATGSNLMSSFEGSNIVEPASGITLIAAADLNLAPLGDYGGSTKTMHPLAGSPAILTTASTTRTDQRGFTLTGPATIGALKLGAVTLATDESSLRTALADSTDQDGAIIRFDQNLSGQIITLTEGQLDVPGTANGLFIDASGLPAGLTIDANQESQIMEIQPGAIAALHGLTLAGGITAETGPLNLVSGGAIYNDQATLSLSFCTLSGNSAADDGGAIYNDGSGGGGRATLSLSVCTLSGNSTGDDGGAIYNNGTGSGNSILSLTSCTLSDNFAGDDGGGVFSAAFSGGKATLIRKNTILSGNTASTGPDLRQIATTIINMGGNLLGGDPKLAPLGDYGGPNQTMIPLPGSPAIDAAIESTRTIDQRGFEIVGTADIGAAEFQGISDLAPLWETDTDGDGTPFGVEFSLGTDPFVSDARSPQALVLSRDGVTDPALLFGQNPDLPASVIVRIMRSPDLQPDSFSEVARYDSTTGIFTQLEGEDTFVEFGPPTDLFFSYIDADQDSARAFYRIEAILGEEGS